MNLTKRITSLVLTLVMLVSLACTGAWTPHVHAEEQLPLDDLQIVHVNPLYAGTVTEDDLVEPDHSKLYSDNTDGKYYYDAASAADLIRDDLVARDTTIVVDAYCKFNSADTVNADAKQLVHDVLGYAMAHTGNPVEGDYLLWQYAGFQAQMTNAQHDDTNIYMTITYTMTYHTSAAQEAEMDTAVAKLLGSLNVSGADDHTKLSAIYDYICSNISYDNLNDESYTLKHTAYAALINKTAVCQGYALLLYRLALELDVDCRLIAGTSNGENHGWNIAQLDDLYYNLDSTWDAGNAEYQYFLVSPKNFSNHTRWDEYDTADFHKAYPMAQYNYTTNCTHTYASAITTNPTCTDKGVKTYTCSKCGDSYTESVPSTGHNYDKSEITAPTCTDKGYTTHTCSGCGDFYQDTLVAATGHSYDNGVITKEATCAAVGIKTFTCANCKQTYTEELPKLDHVYDKAVVTAPTCTDKGYTTHSCVCGDSYQDTFVDATGHSYDAGVVTQEATCSAEGIKTYTCTKCGDTIQEAFAALGHAYDDGKVVTEPTCTESGIKTHTCSRCDSTIKAIIDPLGHAYDEGTVTTEPTCTEDGVMTYTCTRGCGNTTTGPAPALGHGWDDGIVTTEPTCTEEGVRTYTCTHGCGYGGSVAIPAKGHEFADGACVACGIKAVAITAEPKTAYAQMGEVAKATVTAEGDDLQYQWYIRNADKTKYSKSSVTGPTYSCKMSEKSKDRRALCIITDKYGNEVQSKTIVIREAVSIVTEPKTAYAKSGATAKVEIEASGDGLTYQWYIRDAGESKYTKSTVKTDTYTAQMSDKINGRRVRCVIKDKYGNKIETKTVVLRMSATITSQPKSVTVKKGATAEATVKAVGTDLTYQWYIKNKGSDKFVKSSVTDATYTVKMAKKVDGRQAYCVVTDKYGKTAKSDIITLSMK